MKAEIRNSIWQLLTQQGTIRFPQASGRIPNFVGAGQAARQLRELTVWRRAQIIKVNPDAPQLPVRRAALQDGKILYMAVPSLRAEKCFLEIDPQKLGNRALLAANMRGALKYGRLIAPREMRQTDLIICGSVAVGRDGAPSAREAASLTLNTGFSVKKAKYANSPQLLQPSIRNSLSPTRFPCSPMIFQSIFSSPRMK